jgi:hypothetical protein
MLARVLASSQYIEAREYASRSDYSSSLGPITTWVKWECKLNRPPQELRRAVGRAKQFCVMSALSPFCSTHRVANGATAEFPYFNRAKRKNLVPVVRGAWSPCERTR